MSKYIQKQTPELVLRNSTKFAGKHLCQSHFLNKVAGLRFTTLLKKRLWHRCFPMNFAKFFRTLFLHNASGRLLLLLLLLLFLILSVIIIIFNIIIITIIITFIFSIIDIIVSITIFYRPIWVPIGVTEERYSSRCIQPSSSQVIGPELSDCRISYKQQI